MKAVEFGTIHPTTLRAVQGGELSWTMSDQSMACAACGAGTQGFGSRRFSGLKSTWPKWFYTYAYDAVVSPEIASKLQRVENVELDAVVDGRGKETGWRVVRCTKQMPRANRIDHAYCERQCAVCRQNGYFERPQSPTGAAFWYTNAQLSEAFTIGHRRLYRTFELFGETRKRTPELFGWYPQPFFVVERQLYEELFPPAISHDTVFIPIREATYGNQAG